MVVRIELIAMQNGRLTVKFAASRGNTAPVKAVTVMNFESVAELREKANKLVDQIHQDDLVLLKAAEVLQAGTTLAQAKTALEGKTFELAMPEKV